MKNNFETPKFEIITLNCDVVYTSSDKGADAGSGFSAIGEAPKIPKL